MELGRRSDALLYQLEQLNLDAYRSYPPEQNGPGPRRVVPLPADLVQGINQLRLEVGLPARRLRLRRSSKFRACCCTAVPEETCHETRYRSDHGPGAGCLRGDVAKLVKIRPAPARRRARGTAGGRCQRTLTSPRIWLACWLTNSLQERPPRRGAGGIRCWRRKLATPMWET